LPRFWNFKEKTYHKTQITAEAAVKVFPELSFFYCLHDIFVVLLFLKQKTHVACLDVSYLMSSINFDQLEEVAWFSFVRVFFCFP